MVMEVIGAMVVIEVMAVVMVVVLIFGFYLCGSLSR